MTQKQFVVVEAGMVDPSQFLGSVVLVDAEGNPWSPGGGAEPVVVTWATLSGKPATFPPTVGTTATTAAKGDHVHAVAGITGLQAALDAKATSAALTALAARVTALEAA